MEPASSSNEGRGSLADRVRFRPSAPGKRSVTRSDTF